MISMNRNTCPIPPLSETQILKAIQNTSLNLYPEKEREKFIDLYAQRYHLDPSTIEVANGSDEWIQKIVMTLGNRGVMSLNPDFSMYKTYSGQIDVPYYNVDCESDYSFDYEKMIAEVQKIKPSVFFISNPHNPTGVLFPDEFLNRLADTLNEWGGYLVVDEAYVEFASHEYSPTNDNTLLIRTMSKIYGVAGLRIGILIAKGETFKKVTRINHPYPMNSVSLNLAIELLSNEDSLNSLIDYQKQSKVELSKALNFADSNIKIKESHSNFIFTYGESAKSLALYLIDNGFTPRVYEGSEINNFVRYSIIDLEQYPELTALIKTWTQTVSSTK